MATLQAKTFIDDDGVRRSLETNEPTQLADRREVGLSGNLYDGNQASTSPATKQVNVDTEAPVTNEPKEFLETGGTFGEYISQQLELQQQAFDRAFELMAPSPEEAAAQREIDQLNAQAQLAQQGLEGQGMDLQFIQGRQEQIQKVVDIKRNALQTKLARLQNGRLTRAEIAQAQAQGINHQLNTAIKLKELTMPSLKDTFTDKQTGEVFGLFQDVDGNVVQRNIGSVSPEVVKDFDLQGTFDNGSQIIGYGNDSEGNFVTRTLGSSFRSRTGTGGGGGEVNLGGNSYYTSVIENEIDGGSSVRDAVAAAKILADEFGDKVDTDKLFQYGQQYAGQQQGASQELGGGIEPFSDFVRRQASGDTSILPKPEREPVQLNFRDFNEVDFGQVADDIGIFFANN